MQNTMFIEISDISVYNNMTTMEILKEDGLLLLYQHILEITWFS